MNKIERTVQLTDFFVARGNTYTLLANLFLGEFEEVKRSLASVSLEKIGEIDDLVLLINDLKEAPLDELKVQHDNLFVVPASFFVPPFSAHHLSFRDEEEEEEYFHKINHYYRTFGFSVPFERFERVDHIGYLLAFTAYVNEATLALIEEGDEENFKQSMHFQRAFLNHHVQSWIGTLEKEVSLKLNRGLLLNAVRYLHQFIEWDHNELAEM